MEKKKNQGGKKKERERSWRLGPDILGGNLLNSPQWKFIQATLSAEKWIKDLLSMALTTRARPTQVSLQPVRKLAQVSYPHSSEDRQNEKPNHRKLNKMIT